MNKKILSMIVVITMIIMSIPVLGANGDGYAYDEMLEPTTSIPNKYLVGDYELGTVKEFIVQIFGGGYHKGEEAYREVEIVGEHQVSNFIFQDDDGEWKNYTEYNKKIVIKNMTHTFHVTFEEEGIYQVRANLVSKTGESIFKGKRFILVKDGKISITTEPETTTTTEPETTTAAEPETTTVAEPETTTVAEPETTAKQPETTTKKPETTTKKPGTTKAPKVKVKKGKKKKSSKTVKITLKKVKGAKRYQVQIAKSKKFTKKNILVKKTIKKAKLVKKAKFTIQSKKIKNKKKLYARARVKVNGKYGAWGKAKKIKVSR